MNLRYSCSSTKSFCQLRILGKRKTSFLASLKKEKNLAKYDPF